MRVCGKDGRLLPPPLLLLMPPLLLPPHRMVHATWRRLHSWSSLAPVLDVRGVGGRQVATVRHRMDGTVLQIPLFKLKHYNQLAVACRWLRMCFVPAPTLVMRKYYRLQSCSPQRLCRSSSLQQHRLHQQCSGWLVVRKAALQSARAVLWGCVAVASRTVASRRFGVFSYQHHRLLVPTRRLMLRHASRWSPVSNCQHRRLPIPSCAIVPAACAQLQTAQCCPHH